MDTQDIAIIDGGVVETKGHDLKPLRCSDKSLSNGDNGIPVSKISGCRDENAIIGKRRSPRLLEIPESKRPYYGPSRLESLHCPTDGICKGDIGGFLQKTSGPYVGVSSEGNAYLDDKQKCSASGDDVSRSGSTILDVDAPSTSSLEGGKSECFDSQLDDNKWLVSSPNADGKSAYAKVKETLRTYNTIYLQAVQEEDNRCSIAAEKSKRKETGVDAEDTKISHKRPDLKATSKMKKEGLVLYPRKKFGQLPGIYVGFQFFSRAEMVALGFHSHWLSGIDYIGTSSDAQEYKDYKFPLAVAIVLSGVYEDNKDDLDNIVYTGQGGNDLLGRKHQIKDQELSRGNLALKNNFEQSIPVRVVRGNKTARNSVKIYTYDGLYKVVEHWSSRGVSGFIVYKYRLQRIKGQPNLTTKQVEFINGNASNAPRRRGPVCSDISGGQEKLPIRVVNLIDDTLLPAGFTYSKSVQLGENITLPSNASGCKCKGNCSNPQLCACARLNGFDFPYVRRDGGRLIEAKDVVFECGPNCGCGPECINRISQQGIKYKLEVFRTTNKGWATRTLDYIPSGAPVCEYTGLLRRTDDLDDVSANDYIFEIDGWQTMKEIGGRERRMGVVSTSLGNNLEIAHDKAPEDGTPEFCIDAGSIGNVARFINHSCEPNLFVQCVLSSHHDMRFARIVLFAADGISPGEELTYDYAYPLDSVVDSSGKVVEMLCHCGTNDCRKRLY